MAGRPDTVNVCQTATGSPDATGLLDAAPLPVDALPGMDDLAEHDFLQFLGDLADPLEGGDDDADVLDADVLVLACPPPAGAPLDLGLVQQPMLWQQEAGLRLAPPARQPSRGSSCSSEASALENPSGGSSMVAPGSPTTSSDATRPTPSSAGSMGTPPAPARTRAQRTQQRQQQHGAPPAAPGAATTSTGTASGSREQQQQQQESSQPLTKAQLAAAKRRAPVVDWRAIQEPEERRKQRRLAKNRVTAARSRERKKEAMASMEQRLAALEADNSGLRSLLTNLMAENTSLKAQLASPTRGAVAGFETQGSGPEPAALKCLATMHLAACFLCCLEASLGLVLPLLSVLVQQGAGAAGWQADSSSRGVARAPAAGSTDAGGVGCRPVAASADGAYEWWRVRLRPCTLA